MTTSSTELDHIHDRLSQPVEMIFGRVATLAQAQEVYRRLARAVHPDHATPSTRTRAAECFQQLLARWQEAKAKFRVGTYGQVTLFTLTTPAGLLAGTGLLGSGTTADVYAGMLGADPVVIKLARRASDNARLDHEAKILPVARGATEIAAHFPHLLHAMRSGPRRLNVFAGVAALRRLTSAEAVVAAFPDGIDPKDMVWMWKRHLGALGGAHHGGVVHGAVTPDHVLLDLADHNGVLVGWSGAGLTGTKPAGPRRGLAPETLAGEPLVPATDLWGLAKVMETLLGGPAKAAKLPKPLGRLLRGCLTEHPRHRLDDAWALHQDIDRLLPALWGAKQFRVFTMPATAGERSH
jgi:hypothetical protein